MKVSRTQNAPMMDEVVVDKKTTLSGLEDPKGTGIITDAWQDRQG